MSIVLSSTVRPPRFALVGELDGAEAAAGEVDGDEAQLACVAGVFVFEPAVVGAADRLDLSRAVCDSASLRALLGANKPGQVLSIAAVLAASTT